MLFRSTADAELLVSEYTGLRAPGSVSARVLDRRDWVDANLVSMRTMLEPLLDRFGRNLARSPIAPVTRRIAAGEVGALLGYMAQRVLGQYDLLVPDDAGDAVYYVGGNILALEKRFAFRPRDFRLWIAIHEVTHRMQFTGVPWMRDHFLGLVHKAFGLVDPDPRTVVRSFTNAIEEVRAGRNPLDEGGIAALFASPEQRGVLGEVQALMSLLEGHGNVVMDDLGARHVAGQERMSRILQQRRAAGGLTGLIHKLLGIEQKMKQYEVGEQFVRGVLAAGGPRALDVVWESPDHLPRSEEIADPTAWLRRVTPAAVASS